VPVAAPDEVAVHRDAREAVDLGAIDHDVVVRLERRVERLGRIEMKRARDPLRVIGPAVEGHDELEWIASIELRLQLVPTDRLDRLRAEDRIPMGLFAHDGVNDTPQWMSTERTGELRCTG
jgi:hypothetical protein